MEVATTLGRKLEKNKWELNNLLLNNYWVNEETKEEMKKYLKINENSIYQNLRLQQKQY